MTCEQPDCTGNILDGYCDLCGMAPRRGEARATATATASRSTARRPSEATRGPLGEPAPTPPRAPAGAVPPEPAVAEARRFCARCHEPVGRSRDGAPGRTEGFCRGCGAHFSFTPKVA